jgi:hypothetical protein
VLALVSLAAWLLEPAAEQEWTQMLDVASGAWLAGIGLAPTVGGVEVTLIPWGFALLPLFALVTAVRWALTASAAGPRGESMAVSLAASAVFGAFAGLLALISPTIGVSPLRAVAVAAAFAFAVAAVTSLRRARMFGMLSERARVTASAAAVGLLTLAILSSIALLVAIILHVDDITSLLVQLDGGIAGTLMLAVLSLGYLPVALTWSMAYLLGPGFAVASGSVVGPFSVSVDTALPGFPLLAALPGEAPAGTFLLPLTGVVAGVVAGLLFRSRARWGWVAVPDALAAAGGVGAAASALAWLAQGSLGTASLLEVGPAPLAVGLAAGLTVAVGCLGVVIWPRRSTDV